MSFHIWDAAKPDDFDQWLSRWHEWPHREIFAHPAYAQLYVHSDHIKVCCAVYADENGSVLYPFLLRDLTTESYWDSSLPPAADIITPYGYGGPFVRDVIDRNKLADIFWQHFDTWAQSQHIVSEFIRFSLFADDLLPYPGQQILDRQNVVRSLELDDDQLWMDFKHKVRKNVKRARKEQIEICTDTTGNRLVDFLAIYETTMDRRNAAETYQFSADFFKQIHQTLAGQFVYFYALSGEQVVSAELVLVSAHNIYSFLGGTLQQAFPQRPNDLLKYEIIRYAQAEGKRNFVLGGGYQPEDGIFQYKLSFAPNGLMQFYTGRRILDTTLYDQLLRQKYAVNDSFAVQTDYFPAYRA